MNEILSSDRQSISKQNIHIDPLQKYKKLYFIFGAIGGATLLIISFNIIAVLVGVAFGMVIAWFIMTLISSVQITKLNFKSYPLSLSITNEQLWEYLKNNFSHNEIEIDKGFLGLKFIFRKSSIYTIHINEEKKKYSITSTATAKAKFKNGGKANSQKLYKDAVYAIPIIREVVEEAVLSINKTSLNIVMYT